MPASKKIAPSTQRLMPPSKGLNVFVSAPYANGPQSKLCLDVENCVKAAGHRVTSRRMLSPENAVHPLGIVRPHIAKCDIIIAVLNTLPESGRMDVSMFVDDLLRPIPNTTPTYRDLNRTDGGVAWDVGYAMAVEQASIDMDDSRTIVKAYIGFTPDDMLKPIDCPTLMIETLNKWCVGLTVLADALALPIDSLRRYSVRHANGE